LIRPQFWPTFAAQRWFLKQELKQFTFRWSKKQNEVLWKRRIVYKILRN
jgi:hypothetical protein